MRPTTFITIVFSIPGFSAHASTGWTQGYAMGTVEARVMAADGAVFGLRCAEGQNDRNVVIQLERPRTRFANVTQLAEVIVDERHLLFTIIGKGSNTIAYSEAKISDKNQLMIMKDALTKSRSSMLPNVSTAQLIAAAS